MAGYHEGPDFSKMLQALLDRGGGAGARDRDRDYDDDDDYNRDYDDDDGGDSDDSDAQEAMLRADFASWR